ncbi:hypothetical protein [Salibacterium halotolerans]|nr:hypothetical protein [Salibacterium halotolerans]
MQIMDDGAKDKDKEYELRVQDAEKEGMEKGKHENKQAVAASMVEEDFDIETIVRLTGLDTETVHRIKESQE